jgi:hypothetical protein
MPAGLFLFFALVAIIEQYHAIFPAGGASVPHHDPSTMNYALRQKAEAGTWKHTGSPKVLSKTVLQG